MQNTQGQQDFLMVDAQGELPRDYAEYLEWAGKPLPPALQRNTGLPEEIDGLPFSPGRVEQADLTQMDTEDPLRFFQGVWNGILATAGLLMLAWVAYHWLVSP